MNLYGRFIAMLALLKFRRRISFTAPSVKKFRVWPSDLDAAGHVNNAKYVAMLDLGRLDLWVRTGFWDVTYKGGWSAVVAAQTIRYHRSLKPFEKFTLSSQLLGWDEKAFYYLHEFRVGGTVSARAVVQVRVLSKTGSVSSAEAIARVGDVERPELPAWVQQWATDVRAGL